ncbi:hypothetical protein Nepgr_023848 [Nepenthes gracilis]|uniref:Anaphase-promoting complex subunit 4-like WD40 domain-containing protein n=1 Tax=Nepenthes gracilis TaxID=150966 RepID=A0AAD3XZH7_NEPGR|nr:hypothetical protein Nepgr_023848 [Nepenthes gracilis]
MNRTRIFAFKNKAPAPPNYSLSVSLHNKAKPVTPKRRIPRTSERTLDAPDLLDDFYLNLMDWGSSNILAFALGSTVYLWDASSGSTSELVMVDDENGPVTSVSWAPDGKHIAIGLNNSKVQLWDSTAIHQLRTLKGGHRTRVGSLAWNNHILTSGGMDSRIINNDVRIRDHIVETYRGHNQEVCGLKWSASCQRLASRRQRQSPPYMGQTYGILESCHHSVAAQLEDHTALAKALAWCPFQGQVIGLWWRWWRQVHQILEHPHWCLLEFCGYWITVPINGEDGRAHWPYFQSSFHGTESRWVAQKASARVMKLSIRNVFGTPEAAKPAPKTNPEPFPNVNRIR